MHLLLTAAGHAAHTTGSTTTVSAWSLLLQLVIGLAVVLGVIVLIARLMRGRVGAIRRSSAPLAVVGRVALGKGVQVAIVRAGADTYVLGVTSQHITRIGRFSEEPPDRFASVDDLPPDADPGTPPRWQWTLRQLQDKTVRRT